MSGTYANLETEAAPSCTSRYETETFTATTAQTSFVLSHTPIDDVHFARNGASLSDAAATVSGSTVTYVPAANGSWAMVAGDRVDISYSWLDCTAVAVGELDGPAIVGAIIGDAAARDLLIHPSDNNSLRWELDGADLKLYENDGTLPGSV